MDCSGKDLSQNQGLFAYMWHRQFTVVQGMFFVHRHQQDARGPPQSLRCEMCTKCEPKQQATMYSIWVNPTQLCDPSFGYIQRYMKDFYVVIYSLVAFGNHFKVTKSPPAPLENHSHFEATGEFQSKYRIHCIQNKRSLPVAFSLQIINDCLLFRPDNESVGNLSWQDCL